MHYPTKAKFLFSADSRKTKAKKWEEYENRYRCSLKCAAAAAVTVVEFFILTMVPSPIKDTFMRRSDAVGGAVGYAVGK